MTEKPHWSHNVEAPSWPIISNWKATQFGQWDRRLSTHKLLVGYLSDGRWLKTAFHYSSRLQTWLKTFEARSGVKSKLSSPLSMSEPEFTIYGAKEDFSLCSRLFFQHQDPSALSLFPRPERDLVFRKRQASQGSQFGEICTGNITALHSSVGTRDAWKRPRIYGALTFNTIQSNLTFPHPSRVHLLSQLHWLKVPWRIDYKLSRSIEGVCVPLSLMNCLFPVPDSRPTVTELFQSPLYGAGTVFRSISHLLRHFLFSALVWRHTSSNCVTRNYFCRAREVTLSFIDTLIALTYLLTYLFLAEELLLLLAGSLLSSVISRYVDGCCVSHR